MERILTVLSQVSGERYEGDSMYPGGFMLSFYRNIRTLNSPILFPPKASAPQTSRSLEASSSSGPVSGMKPKEEKLAGYLLARTAMNQKVEGSTLKNLRAGHETVQQVGELLPLGRANVIPDIENAKGEHLPLRKLAADSLVDHVLTAQVLRGGEVTDADNNAAIAAAAQHAKTGTCGCFAANTTALHGAKLADMEDKRAVVSIAQHSRHDHEWSEMLPKGVKPDGTPILHGEDVIMDGWTKEKAAILREDSQFARLDKSGRADQLQHDDSLNHVTGPEALKALEKYKARIANSQYFQDVFKQEFNKLVADKVGVSKIGLWKDTSIFNVGFRIQASRAMHKEGNPSSAGAISGASLTEIQAVGVARSLGANVRGAIAEAPGIIASAKDMFPNL